MLGFTLAPMKTIFYVARGTRSLSTTQRRTLFTYLILQVVNSMLEIIGVLLLGLLVLQAQGTALDTSASAVSSLNRVLPSNYLGLSQGESLLLLLSLSLLCFSAKALIAPL